MGMTDRRAASPVLVASAGAAVALLVATGVVVRDFEAIAIGVALVAATALLWLRKGLVGRLALFLLFADILFWMAPAAWSNAHGHASISGLLIPLVLVALSTAGIASVVGAPDRVVALGRALMLAASLIAGVALADSAHAPRVRGAVAVSARGAKFLDERLDATGPVITIVFRNHDLFWHTFTIDGLGVNVRAPLNGTRQARFRAAPGTYKFYCAIPGHESAGMRGTLTVRTT